jgi:hypothetical protein
MWEYVLTINSFQLSQADIVAPNLEAWGLYIDFWIIGDASREFPATSWVGIRSQNELLEY